MGSGPLGRTTPKSAKVAMFEQVNHHLENYLDVHEAAKIIRIIRTIGLKSIRFWKVILILEEFMRPRRTPTFSALMHV